MSGHRRREVPGQLLRLKQRFAQWRKARVPGQRIPEPLWNSAAKLASAHGLNQTAKVLGLDYYSLKRRVAKDAGNSTSPAAFVELSPASMAIAKECIIEMEDGMGASLRMHFKGTEMPDVLALGHRFWNAE
jgi:hypothetical protein